MSTAVLMLGLLWAAGAIWSATFAVRMLRDRFYGLAALNLLSTLLFVAAAVANFSWISR